MIGLTLENTIGWTKWYLVTCPRAEVFIFFVETLALGSKYTCKKLYEMFLNERITSHCICHFEWKWSIGMIRTTEDLTEEFPQVIAKIEQ